MDWPQVQASVDGFKRIREMSTGDAVATLAAARLHVCTNLAPYYMLLVSQPTAAGAAHTEQP